jgi:hypothetical protein
MEPRKSTKALCAFLRLTVSVLPDLKGYLPVDADVVDGRPGLRWLDMSGVSLSEPFFEQTVERAKADGRGEVFTEFDVLLQLEKLLDTLEPTGFIFHSSRCGSTLVANACRAVSNSIVLSEANPIDKLIARFITDAARKVKESTLLSLPARRGSCAWANAGAATNSICSSSSPAAASRKSSASLASGQTFRWLFLYRDPIETIVSNLNEIPPWLIDKDRRVLAAINGVSPAAVAEMRLEELCARTIGSLYATAHRLANANSMLLNYTQLSVPEIVKVLRFFKLARRATKWTRSRGAADSIQKKLQARASLWPTRMLKQQHASVLIREMAAAWASEPYRLLEQKRIQSNTW